MNILDILILAIVLVLVVLVLRLNKGWTRKRGCMGDCSKCGNCRREERKGQ